MEYKVLYTPPPDDRCPFTERQLVLKPSFWAGGSPVNTVRLRCATFATATAVMYAGNLKPLSFDEYTYEEPESGIKGNWPH